MQRFSCQYISEWIILRILKYRAMSTPKPTITWPRSHSSVSSIPASHDTIIHHSYKIHRQVPVDMYSRVNNLLSLIALLPFLPKLVSRQPCHAAARLLTCIDSQSSRTQYFISHRVRLHGITSHRITLHYITLQYIEALSPPLPDYRIVPWAIAIASLYSARQSLHTYIHTISSLSPVGPTL